VTRSGAVLRVRGTSQDLAGGLERGRVVPAVANEDGIAKRGVSRAIREVFARTLG